MKSLYFLFCLAWVFDVPAQGTFLFRNHDAKTRLGSIEGPFAGSSILAQMLVGETADSLTPVGAPIAHVNGGVPGPTVTVPNIPGNTTAYLQMVAWDGDLWGSSITSVPMDQFGRTDVVPFVLSFSFDPSFPPQFTQPAIVPIPEPSTWALAVLGTGAFLVHRFIRCCRYPK